MSNPAVTFTKRADEICANDLGQEVATRQVSGLLVSIAAALDRIDEVLGRENPSIVRVDITPANGTSEWWLDGDEAVKFWAP